MPDAITTQMAAIRDQWGAAIAAACAGTDVLPEFLAALIGNETGGNPNAQRFEHGVLLALWQVLLGRAETFGSISRANLLSYLTGSAVPPITSPSTVPADILQRIDGLSTSWGLTQIMGYNAVFPAGGIPLAKPEMLVQPATNLQFAIRGIVAFAHRWDLDLGTDFAKLFACWNSGRPDPTRTFDPQYVPNGLARLAAYKSLPPAADSGISTPNPAGN